MEIPRIKEAFSIQQILNSNKYELCFVRGRRRVGKTYLLRQFEERNNNILYFYGEKDSRTKRMITDFITDLQAITNKNISEKPSRWKEVFKILRLEAEKYYLETGKILTIVFDEVQWIAKKDSGFLDALKAEEPLLKKMNKIKFILCGSSMHFFEEQENHGQALLRGMKTRNYIDIKPFTYKEIFPFFREWKKEEVAFLYMLTGGVPYYLAQVSGLNFKSAINQAFFTKDSIFLKEIDQILEIDFKTNRIKTIKIILSYLINQNGHTLKSLSEIALELNISYANTNTAMNALYELGYLSIVKPNNKTHGLRYKLTDFYLFFYFAVLYPSKDKIANNIRADLFSDLLLGNGMYLNGFTGYAFENFLEYNFKESFETDPSMPMTRVYESLNIIRPINNDNLFSYNIGNKGNQFDLVYVDKIDEIVYLFEAKWGKYDSSWIKKLSQATFNESEYKNYKKQKVLVCYDEHRGSRENASEEKIILLSLDDFY